MPAYQILRSLTLHEKSIIHQIFRKRVKNFWRVEICKWVLHFDGVCISFSSRKRWSWSRTSKRKRPCDRRRFIDFMLIRRRNLIATAPPAAIQLSFIIARASIFPAYCYFDVISRETARTIFLSCNALFLSSFPLLFDPVTVVSLFSRFFCYLSFLWLFCDFFVKK